MALAAGAMVSELELPDVFQEAFAAHQTIQDYEACRALAWEMDRHGDELSPILRETLERGRAIPAERYDAARRKAREARLAARSLFDEVDVLLTPSAPGHAPEGLASTGSSIFNRLWTLLGLPAVNVPGLAAANGLPLGVQVVGRFGRDSATLAAAHWLEQVILRRA
jgi:Asp-tRNA(Asn)/Glu-tRNA(Gln) amidotransferase A subunit family amidase